MYGNVPRLNRLERLASQIGFINLFYAQQQSVNNIKISLSMASTNSHESQLPSIIWQHIISNFLNHDAESIGRLWMTGNRILQNQLQNGNIINTLIISTRL